MNRNAPRTDPKGNFINNIILASIPDEEFSKLKPHLEHVALEAGRTWTDQACQMPVYQA